MLFRLVSAFLLAAIVSASHHEPGHGHRGHGAPYHHGGHSNTYRKQDDHGNYAFGYEIKDPHGASNFRKETGSTDHYGNNVWGSYGLADIDGRWRTVNYVADKDGFRAKIDTNEPGTGNVDPAAVIINGADQHGGSHTNIASGHAAPNYNDGSHHHGHGHEGPHPLPSAPIVAEVKKVTTAAKSAKAKKA